MDPTGLLGNIDIGELLRPEEVSKIEESFRMFDHDNSDTVYPKDIIRAMQDSGYDKTKGSLFELFKEIDTEEYNKSGISFRTFSDFL